MSNSVDDDIPSNSFEILSDWKDRAGVDHKTILEETQSDYGMDKNVHRKTFTSWFGKKRIRAPKQDPNLIGDRVVALVSWFVAEHKHRKGIVVKETELERFISLYPELPPKHRLQAQRLLWELQNQRDSIFVDEDWKTQFSRWVTFSFVMDRLWCMKATSKYGMELVGLREQDAINVMWWHRLATNIADKGKYEQDSKILSLRGPYAEDYYLYQLARFRNETQNLQEQEHHRFVALMELLHTTPGFTEMWEKSLSIQPDDRAMQIPIPFFRPDGTLLWMIEMSVTIPKTEGYRLISWMTIDADSHEYLAHIKRLADQSDKYSADVLYVEDYASKFTERERFALGVNEF